MRVRAPLDEVLEAVLAGDLVLAIDIVERAGGLDAFGDDAALVEALCSGRGHDVARAEVKDVARRIAADVPRPEGPDTPPRGRARELLATLASHLGLTPRPRAEGAPVVLRARADEPNAGAAAHGFSGVVRATSVVRGIYRDLFARETWMPRVDRLALLVPAAAAPGVYALQRRALSGAEPTTTPRPEAIAARLGSGRALPEALRRELAARLADAGREVDLARVRIHEDLEADRLCRELGAEAFAFGEALVFRSGAFRPDDPGGLELLLHELAHVGQQARGEVAPGVDADPALEREAERVAERAVAVDSYDDVAVDSYDDVAVGSYDNAVDSYDNAAVGSYDDVAVGSYDDGAIDAFDAAVQRCGPREMAARQNPPRPHPGPRRDDPVRPEPNPPEPEPPEPDPPKPEPGPDNQECESCPEPDLAHQTFEPLRELPDKPATAGQKVVELRLAGHVIKVEVPEAQAAGEVEVVFRDNPSPFAGLHMKKAKLRFDADLRVLDGEIACAVALGKYVRVADTTLRVFEDGRIGAEIRGIEVNVADNLRALVDLVIGPEGVWGMCTVTADKVFVSETITVKDGLLHVRVEKNGSVDAHGALTLEARGIGEVTLEACYVDGKWGGRVTFARREELELAPGVVLEEVEVTGCFAPDEWWVYGALKVRVLDRFRITADARYHWKAGEGTWSFEGDLAQFESMPLVDELTLENVAAHAKLDEGHWQPATFHAEVHHPWVIGTLDGTWAIEENLWSGTGRVELARQLPMGDSGITLDQAAVTAHVVDNTLTEIHGEAAATFPFQGEPTFELSCRDAVYKVKEEALWATADLRSIRDIVFGQDTGFHAIVRSGAGATATVEATELTKTLGGMAFEAWHRDKLIGDGGLHFDWVPGGGVNAGGRFDLRDRFGLPDDAAGPLYLLPQPGHFEFQVVDGEPSFIEAQGVGFEIARGGADGAGGLIGGEVSGRFDFATDRGDLRGTARVVKPWTEPLGDAGQVTFLASETPNLAVAIERSELTRAEGQLDVQLDLAESEHVRAFTLLGHVDGRYDPKTGTVSGRLGAELMTDLDVSLGDGGDRVVIQRGSRFSATMTESVPDTFSMQLVVQYYRQGELFLEGACPEARFDLKTGELDLLGRLTLKKDLEKALGDTRYALALVKDITQLEIEVKKNALVRIGGDVAVDLRRDGEPLLRGALLGADYRIEEELFSGDLDLTLMRDLSWPDREDDRAALPPGLEVALVRGSHVHGHLTDNVMRQAGVELFGRVRYRGRDQAEAFLTGHWDLVDERFDLDGAFRLTNDLVLGREAAADATAIDAWALAFTKGSEVTIGVVANRFQPVTVDVGMELRRGSEACAVGSVGGQYTFGDAAGFSGRIHLEVVREIALGRAGRFDIALSPETRGDGTLQASALTDAHLGVVLLAQEDRRPKARLALEVDYTGGDELSGQADFTVLEDIRVGERQMGGARYAVDLDTRTRASIGLDHNQLTAFSGAVGLQVSRDDAPFAEGDFALDYDFSDPDASVTAEGALRIIGRLELGTVGDYTFSLEGGANLGGRIEDGGLAWIEGALKLGVATPKEGLFAFLELEGRYEGGEQPDFNGSAVATVVKEHDLGFTAFNYGFFLQPASGFSILLKDSAFTEMHGDIGLLARQRSKKKDGMNGDVRMTLSGDAVREGEAWRIDGHADATVEGSIKVGTAGDYVFWIQAGSGIAIEVRQNRFASVEGTLNGKVTEKGKGFLGFDCWVRYEAAENEGDPGFVDARGGCKLLGEKELYRNGGFAFSLMPTDGYTALIVVERNEIKEVGGTLAFRLENQNARPQPLRVVGSAAGHYDNTTGIFSGRGDIRLESDLEFAMGANKIVLERGSGGMTEIEKNELKRLGGTLKGRFDDADGPLVRVQASGDFNAETPELERLEGSATLLRELTLGPAGNPWIIVDKNLSCDVRMAHNKLTYASGKNGRFRVPALRLTGGFDHLTMNAEGPQTKYSGKGFLELEMLKEDKDKGRKLKGRLDLEYREDDTWNARGQVDYAITPYLGGQITAEMDQDLDPVLGGTLVMQQKEMLPARDLFDMKFPLIPDTTIPVAGIAGFGFGARGYFGLSMLPMTLSASVGVANFRPRQMNVPDFQAEAEIGWGLRLKAGAMAYLDARLSVLIASASIGIKGTAELMGDALVKAKGKIAGSQGKYWGELGIGLSFAPHVTLKAQPYAKASLFDYDWEKSWDAYEYDLGEVFKYEWGSTYKFGDQPEAPKSSPERQPASVAGAPRQAMGRVNSKTEAEAFGQERATPAAPATQGRPQMESGEELKKKKEQDDAQDMEGLEKDGKEASDLGSVMAAVGNIITQLGHLLGSLMFGPIGLVLCLAWKWLTGALKKLYDDWCKVRDYIQNNWDKIKEYLPAWFVSFVDFMKSPASAAEKWWNADEYTRDAVHAGEHHKVAAPVRGNMASNLFGGYAGEGDRRAIEDIFEVSLGKGDLRQVVIESGYTPNDYVQAWYRHSDWGGSRLERIFRAAGWGDVQPSAVGSLVNLVMDDDPATAATATGPGAAHAAAREGLAGGGGPLPHQGAIQAAFGDHDVSGITAHTGAGATRASEALGANAYASGEHVAFADGAADLHTAAHEAAHVVQQRQGLAVPGGVGRAGDAYEQHADAVADKVVAGESATGLLGSGAAGAAGAATGHTVQRDAAKDGKTTEGGAVGTSEAPADLGDLPRAVKLLQERELRAAEKRALLLSRGTIAHASPLGASKATALPPELAWSARLVAMHEAEPALPMTELIARLAGEGFDVSEEIIAAGTAQLLAHTPMRKAFVFGVPLAGTSIARPLLTMRAESTAAMAEAAGYETTLAIDPTLDAIEKALREGHRGLRVGDEVFVFIAAQTDRDAFLGKDARGTTWLPMAHAAALGPRAAIDKVTASVAVVSEAVDPKALAKLLQGDGLSADEVELARALAEREADDRLYDEQRAVLERHADRIETADGRTAAAPRRGDVVGELLARREADPGASPTAVVKAWAKARGEAPIGDVARIAASLAGKDRARRGQFYGANAKDMPTTDVILDALEAANNARAMGFEVSKTGPAPYEQLQATLGAGLAGRRGDEAIVYVAAFTSAYYGRDSVYGESEQGYSEEMPTGWIDTLLARGGALGIRTTILLSTDERAHKTGPQRQAHEDDGELAPALVHAGELLRDLEVQEQLSEADRKLLAEEGSQVFTTSANDTTVSGGKDAWTERLLKYRAMHPDMPLRELLAGFQLANLDQTRTPQFQRIGAGLADAHATRRGFVMTSNPADTQSITNIHAQGERMRALLASMGYATRGGPSERNGVTLLRVELGRLFDGLVAGDDVALYFGGHGNQDGILVDNAQGYSVVVPYGELRAMAARGDAMGIHVTVMLDVCYGGLVLDPKNAAGDEGTTSETEAPSAMAGMSGALAEAAGDDLVDVLGTVPLADKLRFAASAGAAESGGVRSAVLIGNAAGPGGWPTAAAHVEQMAAALGNLGFDIERRPNQTATEMRGAIRDLTVGVLAGDDVALYIAGRFEGPDVVGVDLVGLPTVTLHGVLAQARARRFRATVMVEPAPETTFDLAAAAEPPAHLASIAQRPEDGPEVIAAIGAIEVIRQSYPTAPEDEQRQLEAEYAVQVAAVQRLRSQQRGGETGGGASTVIAPSHGAISDSKSFVRTVMAAKAKYGLDTRGAIAWAMRHYRDSLGSGAVLSQAGESAATGRRRALVVVCVPKDAQDLPGARLDAIDMRASFAADGYEVTYEVDITAGRLARLLARFAAELEAGDSGVFYFAGHGIGERSEILCTGTDGYSDNLSMSFLPSVFEPARARGADVQAILDACYMGDVPGAFDREREVGDGSEGALPLFGESSFFEVLWGHERRGFIATATATARPSSTEAGSPDNAAAEALLGQALTAAAERLVPTRIAETVPGEPIDGRFDLISTTRTVSSVGPPLTGSGLVLEQLTSFEVEGADGTLGSMRAPVQSMASLSASATGLAKDGDVLSNEMKSGMLAGRLVEDMRQLPPGAVPEIGRLAETTQVDESIAKQQPTTLNLARFADLGTDDGKPAERRSLHVAVNPKDTSTISVRGDAILLADALGRRGFLARTLIDLTAPANRRAIDEDIAALGRGDHFILTVGGRGSPSPDEGVYTPNAQGYTANGQFLFWREFGDILARAQARQIHVQIAIDACYSANAVQHLQKRLAASATEGSTDRSRAVGAIILALRECERYLARLGTAPLPTPWSRRLDDLAGALGRLGATHTLTTATLHADPTGATRTLLAAAAALSAKLDAEHRDTVAAEALATQTRKVVPQGTAPKPPGTKKGGASQHRTVDLALARDNGPHGDGHEDDQVDAPPRALRDDGSLTVATDFQLVHETTRDLAIDDSVFGAARTDLTQEGLTLAIDGDRAVIRGTLRALHHWNAHAAGKREASVDLATTEPEDHPRYQGFKVYQAMAMDLMPIADNLSVLAVYTNTPLTEVHEQVHVDDAIGFLDAEALGLIGAGWDQAWFDPDDEARATDALDTYREMALRKVEAGLLGHLKGAPPKSYFEQPTEVKAYADGAPRYFALAQQILARGMALEQADGEATDDTGPTLDPTPPTQLDRTLAPTEAASKGAEEREATVLAGADARFVHFEPGTLTIESSVTRGLALDPKAFGAVRQDFAFTMVKVVMVDGRPRVDATLHVTYRWDVQSRGSLPARLDLVSAEPETFDPRLAAYKVWQVMEASVRPDGKNMPSFSPYWDEAEAIAHEQFHVTDDQAWAAAEGRAKLAEGWSLAAFQADGGTLDAATAEANANLWAPVVADFYERASNAFYLGGESDPGYADRAGEVRAYGSRAAALHGLADRIAAAGRALEGGGGEDASPDLEPPSGAPEGGDERALWGNKGPIDLPAPGTKEAGKLAVEELAAGSDERLAKARLTIARADFAATALLFAGGLETDLAALEALLKKHFPVGYQAAYLLEIARLGRPSRAMRVLHAAGAVTTDVIGSEIVSEAAVIALAEGATLAEWPEVWKSIGLVWSRLSLEAQARLRAYDDVQAVLGRIPASGEIDALVQRQLAAARDVHLAAIVASLPRARLFGPDPLPALYDALLAWTKTVDVKTRKDVVAAGSAFRAALMALGLSDEGVELLLGVVAPPPGFDDKETGELYSGGESDDEKALVSQQRTRDESAVGQMQVLTEHAAGNDALYQRFLGQLEALTPEQFKMWLAQQVNPAFAALIVGAKTLDDHNVGVAKAINNLCDDLRGDGLSPAQVADLRARLENHGRGFGAFAWLSAAVSRLDLTPAQLIDALVLATPEDIVRIRKDKSLMGHLRRVIDHGPPALRPRFEVLLGDGSPLRSWEKDGEAKALDLVTLRPEYWALRFEIALEKGGETERARKLMAEIRRFQAAVRSSHARALDKKTQATVETRDTHEPGDVEPLDQRAFLTAFLRALSSRANEGLYTLAREAYDAFENGELVDASVAFEDAIARKDKQALVSSWKELSGKPLLDEWTNLWEIAQVLRDRARLQEELRALESAGADEDAVGVLELRLHALDMQLARWSLDLDERKRSAILAAYPAAEAVELINQARMHLLVSARTSPELQKAAREAGLVLDEGQLVDLAAKGVMDERRVKTSGSGLFDIESDTRRNQDQQAVDTNATYRSDAGLDDNLEAQDRENKTLEALATSRKAYIALTKSAVNWTLTWITGGTSLIAKLVAKVFVQAAQRLGEGAAFDRDRAYRELLLTALEEQLEVITSLLKHTTEALVWNQLERLLGDQRIAKAMKAELDARIEKAVGDVAEKTIVEQRALKEALMEQLPDSLRQETKSWLQLATKTELEGLIDRLGDLVGVDDERAEAALAEGDYETYARLKARSLALEKLGETGEGLAEGAIDAVVGEDDAKVALTDAEPPKIGALAARVLPKTAPEVLVALAGYDIRVLGTRRLEYAARVAGMTVKQATVALDRLYVEAVVAGTDAKLMRAVGIVGDELTAAWLEHAKTLGLSSLTQVEPAVRALIAQRKREAAEADLKSREYHQFPLGPYHGGKHTKANTVLDPADDGRTPIDDPKRPISIELGQKITLDRNDDDRDDNA